MKKLIFVFFLLLNATLWAQLKLIKATKQPWAGGMQGYHGNYYNAELAIQWGRLSLQLSPEKITAENFLIDGLGNNFDGSANGYPGNFWRRYYEISENIIEAPNVHFKTNSDQNFIGQTSLKYHTKNISFGISTENLWWGPGIHYSLVLTNNAPGFLHYTIQTNKPIQTFLGTIEAQFIGGSLQNGFLKPSENDGFGLQSTKNRLNILYRGNALFEIYQCEPTLVTAKLIIPIAS